MKRRQLVKASLTGAVAVGLCGGGIIWLGAAADNEHLTIDAALTKLEALSDRQVSNTGEWNPCQIFTHCAQSVEYSMSGYPVQKSDFFKNSAGQLAFSVFSSTGKMTHDLGDPIPGAPPLVSDIDIRFALDRLKEALLEFRSYEDTPAPHFAYGELSKREFEIAHVMHLYNHLQEIKS